MTASGNKLSASIGPRAIKLEVGWFHGITPALLNVAVCEWSSVHNGGLLYFCLVEVKILKFSVLLTYYPMRPERDDLPM